MTAVGGMRNQRSARRGSVLLSAIVMLVMVAVLSACVLAMHANSVSSATAETQRLRAEAAAMAGIQLALWRVSNDASIKDSIAIVMAQGDTAFSSAPLVVINGDLAGATFQVDVWPGPDNLRLNGRGACGEARYSRWCRKPTN